jgi:hypothetical protein
VDAVPYRKKRRSTVVRTLDPSQPLPSDLIDISHLSRIIVSAPNCTGHGRLRVGPDGSRLPEVTRGFIYYHSPTDIPPTAGEVRFRLTSGDNPESFKMGSDLHVRNTALPWRTTLLTTTEERKIYKPIRELLLADGLVTPALLTKCGEIAKETNRGFRA